MGDSYAWLQAYHIELQTGCETESRGYNGLGWKTGDLVERLPVFELVIPSAVTNEANQTLALFGDGFDETRSP